MRLHCLLKEVSAQSKLVDTSIIDRQVACFWFKEQCCRSINLGFRTAVPVQDMAESLSRRFTDHSKGVTWHHEKEQMKLYARREEVNPTVGM